MDDAGPRYALYFAPDPSSALWRFGCDCIGYDAARGAPCEPPAIEGFARETWLALTDEPRRYGFHATLKAPFQLRVGTTEAGLLEAVESFAASEVAFSLPGLKPALLLRFVALTPRVRCEPLHELAAHAVEALEPFRAPLKESDMQRRLQSPLSATQRSLLQRWGYPYVFDEFRFHMTLTGPLDEPQRSQALGEIVRLHDERVSAGDVAIDAVTLFRQERRDAPFRIIRRAPLCARSCA
jgi:putative phosphonate metabolism protein